MKYILVALFLLTRGFAVNVPKDFGKNAHAVETVSAPGQKIDLDRFLLCMYLYMTELHIDDKPAPAVLVYHVDEDTLRFFGPPPKTGVRMERSRSTTDGSVRYEVWIKEPNDYAYLSVLGGVLADAYQLKPPEILAVANKVRAQFLLMVDVKRLKEHH